MGTREFRFSIRVTHRSRPLADRLAQCHGRVVRLHVSSHPTCPHFPQKRHAFLEFSCSRTSHYSSVEHRGSHRLGVGGGGRGGHGGDEEIRDQLITKIRVVPRYNGYNMVPGYCFDGSSHAAMFFPFRIIPSIERQQDGGGGGRGTQELLRGGHVYIHRQGYHHIESRCIDTRVAREVISPQVYTLAFY